jgi:putative transcriptional regulator
MLKGGRGYNVAIKTIRGENMIKYKFDVIAGLKKAGYSTYRLRKEKLLGEATLQQLRKGEKVSWVNIDMFCKYLKCQPEDILEYVGVEKE